MRQKGCLSEGFICFAFLDGAPIIIIPFIAKKKFPNEGLFKSNLKGLDKAEIFMRILMNCFQSCLKNYRQININLCNRIRMAMKRLLCF